MSGSERDLLAGEYALGTLEGEALTEAERLMATDHEFAREVIAWQNRLAPLSRLAQTSGPPADLWERIEATTSASAAPRDAAPRDNVVRLNRLWVWRAATTGSLALAACLAAFMLIRQPAPREIAVLAPPQGDAPVLIATVAPGGVLTVRPNGTISIPPDRDLELWSLAKGETLPKSLGVLPGGGRRLSAAVAPGTQLIVSLEPRGGSPTGQPTGPVLYAGTVVETN
jgi:anti-sigma-K factor RskA